MRTFFCSKKEHTDCMEARMWESREFGEFADRNLLVSSDGSEDSKETQKG